MADDAESSSSSGMSSPGSSATEATPSPAPSPPPAPLSPEPSASRARSSPPPLSSPRLSCAVCRHQLRRCGPGCPFAPHLPGDQPEVFEKVLRLFTISNLHDLTKKVGPSQHEALFRSIKYEAGAWAEDPVRGPNRVLQGLVDQLRNAFIELVFVHHRLRECAARAEQQTGQPAAQEPNMVITHAAAAAQHYNNRSAAQYGGTARGVTQGHGHPCQHQMTGARQAPAGSNAAREQSMAMSRFTVATQNAYNRYHPAAQYDRTPGRVTHGHGQLSQHQTTVRQMSVGHQAAAAVEGARGQNFSNAHAAPGSNPGAFVFQQQPPPPPVQSGTAPRYPQGQPSQPQSR